MSSTAYRPANSRWRPTLPERKNARAAANGARWFYSLLLSWLAFMAALGLIGVGRHHASRGAAGDVIALLDVVVLVVITLSIPVTWWLSWRMAAAEAGGLSR